MFQDTYTQLFFDNLKRALIIVTPWQNNRDTNEHYRKGWNDCVKDIKQKRTKLLKELEKRVPTK